MQHNVCFRVDAKTARSLNSGPELQLDHDDQQKYCSEVQKKHCEDPAIIRIQRFQVLRALTDAQIRFWEKIRSEDNLGSTFHCLTQ
jgi:hypothetical protein